MVFGPADPTQALAPAGQQPAPRRVDNNVYVTGIGDDTVKQYDFELYSGKANQTDRLFLIRPYQIIKARQHYNEKTKFILCNSEYTPQGEQEVLTKEADCCKMLGSNQLRFAALVLRYITDRNGELVRPFQVPEFRLWKFGVDKFIQLRTIDKDFKLNAHDLKISCTEEKFQRLQIGATPDCVYLHQQYPPLLKQQSEAWAEAALSKVPREMGRRMTDAEIRTALGVNTGAGQAPQMTAADQPPVDFGSVIGGM